MFMIANELLAINLQANANKLKVALVRHQQGQLDQAEIIYKEILQTQPQHFDALQLLATIATQRKDSVVAVELFDQALKINPNNPSVLNNRGIALLDLRYPELALDSYDQALMMQSDNAEVLNNRGNALRDLHRFEQALDSYDRALSIKQDYAEALYNRGNILRDLKRPEQALDSYDQALAIQPDYAEALNNRGSVLSDLKRTEQALDSYDRALLINPDHAETLYNRGNVLHDLNRLQQALGSYDRALMINPDYVEALNNLGNTLRDLNRPELALVSYDRALIIQSDNTETLYNRGNALRDLYRFKQALNSYDRALTINPNYDFLYGTWLHTKLSICDWIEVDSQVSALLEKVERGEKASPPFTILAISNSLSLQKKAAEIYVRAKLSINHLHLELPKPPEHDKIRIGYFSADFRNHPASFLMVELFEAHDRSKFELTAFSFGPDTKDEMRSRIAEAFDRFIDVSNQSDKDVAMLARTLEIDIAVDLGGHTQGCRTRIFALRAAPIQVNYLGYPGTMGAEYIDYIIADTTIIPEAEQQYYSEKIAYLPCFQANDTKRRIADKAPTRSELGLPQTGFVFCCFNNNYKITPSTFDGWMRILRQVEGSVLWLFEDNPKAASNLRNEAMRREVNTERLIFTKRFPLAEYLAMYRMADLFLDTLPFNGGATASDALWAGLPVLTCFGNSFASRMASSLLNAIHLPELVTSTPEAYEALAVELATKTDKLMKIKNKLAEQRLTTPLFNTQLFTQHIEAAYTEMYDRYQSDLAPEHISVSV